MSVHIEDIPALERYCHDLSALAREGHFSPFAGADKWVERTFEVLARRQKSCPALLGRTHDDGWPIVGEVVRRMAVGVAPDILRPKRVVALDWEALSVGADVRDGFASTGAQALRWRLKDVLEEVRLSKGQVILYVRHLHRLFAGDLDFPLDAAPILKPYLGRREVQIIGTCSLDAYQRYIERDAAMERRFQGILTPEVLAHMRL